MVIVLYLLKEESRKEEVEREKKQNITKELNYSKNLSPQRKENRENGRKLFFKGRVSIKLESNPQNQENP